MPRAAPAAEGWVLLGGASLYLLSPYLEDNVAFRSTTTSAGTAGPTALSTGQTNTTQFDWGIQPAFAVWAGAVGPSGVGARARYFRFSGSSQDASVTLTPQQAATPPGASPSVSTFVSPSPAIPDFLPGALPPAAAGTKSFGAPSPVLLITNPATGAGIGQDQLTFSSDLSIHAVDIEPTFAWLVSDWQVILGVGGRYLHLEQNYRAGLVNTGGGLPISVTETLEVSRTFNGGGPTVSGQVNWYTGFAGLAVFASTRGSLLVGTSSQKTTFTQSLNDPTGISGTPGTPVFTRISSRIPADTDAVMPVAEFELGVEYGLVVMNTDAFVRAAVVNQTYFDAGNASSAEGTLSLFGCQLSAGLNY